MRPLLLLIPAILAPMAAPALAQSAREELARANQAARRTPQSSAFSEARQVYAYAEGAIYELNAATDRVSTLLLEPGEAVTAIAAGDTSRWMVTETASELEALPRTVVLVKPLAANVETNIVIVTDRRTYLIEARAAAGRAYAAEIAWAYAGPETTSSREADAEFTAYRIRIVRGTRPRWAPVRVTDDGRRTIIEFSPDVAATELPPLFVLTGEGAELVNYRVDGTRYIVDRIFDRAELRLGVRAPTIVRIERQPVRTPDRRRRRR
jgi:P-type conjugative transfer protein TrbG